MTGVAHTGSTKAETPLRNALRNAGHLPPFAPILDRLIGSLADEHASFSEISGFIEKDAVLTGKILELVNSAANGRPGSVTSVPRAVSMLGIAKVRNCVLGFSVSRMSSRRQMPEYWSHKRFNLHAIATGILADILAQRARVEYGEGAFVAGILHDVGKLMMALAAPDELRAVLRRHRSGEPILDCEQEILGVTHPELSAAAAEQWNLPVAIRRAIRHHHEGYRETEAPTLASLIRLADLHVRELGLTVYSGEYETVPPNAAQEASERLGLAGDKDWFDEFQRNFETIRSCF